MSKRVATLCVGLGLFGCRAEHVFRELDPSWNRMQVQPRYDAYAASPFFGDGKSMQAPPQGSLPYRAEALDAAEQSGMRGGRTLARVPLPITRALLERGRDRFEVFCAACHGVLGDGNSVVATHMRRPPPSLHEPRIRALDDGNVFRVVSQGYGFMPSYAAALSVRDRWGVVAYLRALELSQHAQIAALPPAIAAELGKASR